MTREEARKAAEVMLAYADGKEIECRYRKNSVWMEVNSPAWDFSDYFYRIKPQPTYRPFKDAEERIQEMLKHQPFGWIRNKENGKVNNILAMNVDSVLITEYEHMNRSVYNHNELFRNFEFIDGNPFGMKND